MKLTLERILDAGLAGFATHGAAGLSMRELARTLGVQPGSLYYHVRSKDALLALLADRVASSAHQAGTQALQALPPDAPWPDRVQAQLIALRRTLAAHPGGPALLATSPATLSPGALALMERLLTTLRDAGVPPEHCAVAADTLLSHVTGFVLQEQAPAPSPAATAADVAALAERFPLTMAAGATAQPDEMFLRSLQLQCAGIATLIEPGGEVSGRSGPAGDRAPRAPARG